MEEPGRILGREKNRTAIRISVPAGPGEGWNEGDQTTADPGQRRVRSIEFRRHRLPARVGQELPVGQVGHEARIDMPAHDAVPLVTVMGMAGLGARPGGAAAGAGIDHVAVPAIGEIVADPALQIRLAHRPEFQRLVSPLATSPVSL